MLFRFLVFIWPLLWLLQASGAATFNFRLETLAGTSSNAPTSIDFGPDGRLYVAEQGGLICAYTVVRQSNGSYSVTATEILGQILSIPNHNDDGTAAPSITTRQVTGILAAGTGANPVLYVTSSDPRIGGGGTGGDINLDTNSGIVSRLTWTGTAWDKVDLIRGLPRSEENHSVNGLALDANRQHLYLTVGGSTNAGSPSNNFAFITAYALSACIVRVNLAAIEVMPVQGSGNTKYIYDLPTLNDPTRPGNPDAGDPFGGNDGLNQAKLDPNGPLEIYSPGFRNAYDLVLTQSGRLYTWDNGANSGWGGFPENEGTYLNAQGNLSTDVTNNYVPGEPGSTEGSGDDAIVNNLDGLHLIGDVDTMVPGSYYGGHPNPIRANPAGARPLYPQWLDGCVSHCTDRQSRYDPPGRLAPGAACHGEPDRGRLSESRCGQP